MTDHAKRSRVALQRGTLELRGDTYRYQVRLDGERFNFTIRSDDGLPIARRAAIEAANRKLSELTAPDAVRERRRRRDVGLRGTMPMSALLDEFEGRLEHGLGLKRKLSAGTVATYRDQLKLIGEYFVRVVNDPAVEGVRRRHIEDYLEWRRVNRRDGNVTQRQQKGVDTKPVALPELSARAINKDRALLHGIFQIAERKEYRQGNPVALTVKLGVDDPHYVILNDAQYDALLAETLNDPMLRLYAVLLGETGARCNSEALWLRWEDVDLESGFVRIVSGRDGHRTKSGRGRSVPITPRLKAALHDHLAAFRFSGSPWLFHHVSDHAKRVQAERIGSLRHGFKAAANRAKLPDAFRQHDLRHRRVTTWLAEGQNAVDVQYWMGHSSITVTMGYYHHVPKQLRPVAPAVPAQVAAHSA